MKINLFILFPLLNHNNYKNSYPQGAKIKVKVIKLENNDLKIWKEYQTLLRDEACLQFE